MKHVTRLALAVIAGAMVPADFCNAGEDVPADTRYKYSENDTVSERQAPRTKTVQTVNTRTSRRDAPRWRRVGPNWYLYMRGEVPWSPNAPGG